ncbi:MAG: hypothetical protein H7235_06455 [Bdellovibrionaceae bacterium]|nr:hypothetical protein [Pseudobdellovibrionaceae bacterium]
MRLNSQLRAIDLFAIKKIFSVCSQFLEKKYNLCLYLVDPPSLNFVTGLLMNGSLHFSQLKIHLISSKDTEIINLDILKPWIDLGLDVKIDVGQINPVEHFADQVLYLINVQNKPEAKKVVLAAAPASHAFFYSLDSIHSSDQDIWTFMNPWWEHHNIENQVLYELGEHRMYLTFGKKRI